MNRDAPPPGDADRDNAQHDDAHHDDAIDPRLAALFARDRGPAPHEVAAARLLLKRSLARERQQSAARRPALVAASAAPTGPSLAAARRGRWLLLAQAAGFVLLIALLAPLVPRYAPQRAAAGRTGETVVASLASGALELGARLEQWLPPLPDLGLEPPLAKGGVVERALEPWQQFGDGLRHWLSSAAR